MHVDAWDVTRGMWMGQTKFIGIFSIGVCLVATEPAHAEGFLGTFTSYVGAEKSKKLCDKKSGGGNEAAGTTKKPQDYATEDGTSNSGEVMLAVDSELLKKYRGCKVSIPGHGDNFVINDLCPGCRGNHFDVSFKNSKAGCAAAKAFGKKSIKDAKLLCNGGDRSNEIVDRKPASRPKKRRNRR